MNYMMAKVAACVPLYMLQALKHVASGRADLKVKTGVNVRFGGMDTGEQADSLGLFRNHEELNGIDQALKVHAESADYQPSSQAGKIISVRATSRRPAP